MNRLITSFRKDPSARRHLVFALGLLFFLALLIWKIPYGFGVTDDESFYLSIPNRILQGDSFVSDEWNMSQTSSFLLLPAVAIFKALFHSTDGILIVFRYIYIFGHALSSLFIYWRLRRYGWVSVAAALMHLAFVPYGIDAYSYNTMAVDMLAAGGALCCTADEKQVLPWFLTGLLFAGSVLCCPFLVAVYALYVLCVLLALVLKKKPRMLQISLFRLKSFLLFTLGCGLLAAAFFGYLVLTVDLPTALAGLPHLLTDSDHESYTIFDALFQYFINIGTACPHMNYLYTFSLLGFLCELGMIGADAHRREHRALYLAGGCLLTLLALIIFGAQPALYYQAMMFPLLFVGLPSYILLKNKPREMFVGLFLTGFFYSIADHLSSNNNFFVIAMAFSISNLASIVFVGLLLKEMKEEPDKEEDAAALRQGACLMFLFVLAVMFLLRAQIIRSVCFHDNMPSACVAEIAEGPAKGIRTRQEFADFYQDKTDDLHYLQQHYPAGNLCVLSEDSWPYLLLDEFSCASYSPWFPDDDLVKMNAWWDLHPEKKPDYILAPIWEGTLNSQMVMCSQGIASQEVTDSIVESGYTCIPGRAYRLFVKNDISAIN